MSIVTHTPETTNEPTTAIVGFRFDIGAARQELAKNWKWILAGGIISVVAGIAAVMTPVMATAAVGMVIISTLAVVGLTNIAGVFFAPKGMKLDSFLIGMVQLLTAAVILAYPVHSVVSLTAMIAAVLMLQGVGRIALGWAAWEVKGSRWTIFSGVATVAMCCMILAGLPTTALWVIGTLFGVEMICNGSARVALAMEGRRMTKETAE